NPVLGLLDDHIGVVTPYPAVHLHLLAHRPSEQLVNGEACRLSLDVPKCLVNTGDGTHQDGAATVKTTAVQHLPHILYIVGRPTDDVGRQFVDAGGDRIGTPLHDRFAPADDPLLGGYL